MQSLELNIHIFSMDEFWEAKEEASQYEGFYYYSSQSSTLIENRFCGFPITVFVRTPKMLCCGCAIVRKYTFGVQNIYQTHTHIYRFVWLNRTFTKLSLNIVIILVHLIGCCVTAIISSGEENTQEYMRSDTGCAKNKIEIRFSCFWGWSEVNGSK